MADDLRLILKSDDTNVKGVLTSRSRSRRELQHGFSQNIQGQSQSQKSSRKPRTWSSKIMPTPTIEAISRSPRPSPGKYLAQSGQPGQPGYYPYGNVVIQQPLGYQVTAGPLPDDYMCLAILVTLCCFWPTGIVAIIKTSELRRRLRTD